MSWYNYSRFPERMTVAEMKAKNEKEAVKLKKKNKNLSPIAPVAGRTLAKTYWGKSWIENIESYADYAYRLDRGRSYVRHGSVLDLKIYPGSIEALVSGTKNYTIKITISPVSPQLWKDLINACSGKVNSLIELLQGKLSDHIMTIIAQPGKGLFPRPEEIKFSCSCPDHAYMCKHIAAVLYGIGMRFDSSPELLFTLRQVNQADLIHKATEKISLDNIAKTTPPTIDGDLSDLFGVEIVEALAPKKQADAKKVKTKKASSATSLRKTKNVKAKTKTKKVTRKKKAPKAKKGFLNMER